MSIVAIEEMRPEGRVEICELQGISEVTLGREPERGVAIRSAAVSREHGLLMRFRNHWLYKDLGSTNGSWINGVQVQQGQWKLLRAGDALQMADAALFMKGESTGMDQSIGGRSLLVFSRGSFLEEYPIPEYGRALVVGGSKADLKLDVDIQELPSLVIERRGDKVCAFSILKEATVFLNGKQITHLESLTDRDEVSVGHYSVLLNEPSASPVTQPEQVAAWSGTPAEIPPYDPGFQSTTQTGSFTIPPQNFRAQPRSGFGRELSSDEIDATVAFTPEELRQRLAASEGHPSRRYMLEEDEGPPESLEDKLVLIIGIALLVGLMVMMIWWVAIS